MIRLRSSNCSKVRNIKEDEKILKKNCNIIAIALVQIILLPYAEVQAAQSVTNIIICRELFKM